MIRLLAATALVLAGGATVNPATNPAVTAVNETPAAPPILSRAGDQVTYQAGQNTFIGITTVTVTGAGEVSVSHKRGQTTQEFQGKLTRALDRQMNSALGQFLQHPPAVSRYKPTADEAQIQLKVQRAGQEQAYTFWQNQAETHAGMQAVMDAFQAVAKAVSKGKVTY